MANSINFKSPPIGVVPTVIEYLDGDPHFLHAVTTVVHQVFSNNFESDTISFNQALAPCYSLRIQNAQGKGNNPVQRTWIFKQTIQPLYRLPYRQIAPCAVVGSLPVVCGFVASDGLGDYYQILETAKILQKYFTCIVGVVARVDQLPKRKKMLSLPDPSKFRVAIYDAFADKTNVARQAADQLFQQASMIIETPHRQLCYLYHDFSGDLNPTKVKVHEYDYDKDIGYPIENRPWEHVAMGLGAFTLGIVIKEPNEVPGISALNDLALKELLLGKASAEPDYYNGYHLIFGYLKIEDEHFSFRGDLFIQDFIFSCCLALSKDPKHIDIVCPVKRVLNANWPSEDENHADFDCEALQKAGIQTIQLFHKSATGQLTLVEQIGSGDGKMLRLINPFPLSNGDMQILIKASYRYAGCTGDLSFSEAISYEKLPWYQIMGHKRHSFRAFRDLANGARELRRYLTLLPNIGKRGEDVMAPGTCMGQEKTITQMEQLCALIKKHYCFNPVLIDLVYRNRGRDRYPEIKALEDRLLGDYLAGNKSLSECFSALQEGMLQVKAPSSLQK
jgi:hypothetical protein